MKNISVDLETMGTRPDSCIVSIGAVEFDDFDVIENDGHLGRTFYANVDLQSCLDAGLTVTGGTIMWWLDKPDAARKALLDKNVFNTDLAGALDTFSAFYKSCGADYLWARGQDFDVSILRTAYARMGRRHPWVYNHARDSRTLYDAAGYTPEGLIPPVGEAHNALDDAVWEAKAIIAARRHQAKLLYDLALLRRKGQGYEDPADEHMRAAILHPDNELAQRELAARFK